MDAGRRPLPFASALKASGVETWGRRMFFGRKGHIWMFFFFEVMEFSMIVVVCFFFLFFGGISKRRMIFRTQQMISLKVELE